MEPESDIEFFEGTDAYGFTVAASNATDEYREWAKIQPYGITPILITASQSRYEDGGNVVFSYILTVLFTRGVPDGL